MEQETIKWIGFLSALALALLATIGGCTLVMLAKASPTKEGIGAALWMFAVSYYLWCVTYLAAPFNLSIPHMLPWKMY